MALRKARISDAPSIAALSLEVWIGTYLKRGIAAEFANFALGEFTISKTEALLCDPDQHVVVSDNSEGIDGFMRLTLNCEAPVAGCPKHEIATLYVQPRHHGKGIGMTLLAEALSLSSSNADGGVWLATNAENEPAIKFYLAQGFSQMGETHFQINGKGYLNNVYAYVSR